MPDDKSSKKGGARPGAGRPATGLGEFVGMRFQPDDLAAIDAWAEANECSRTEAIRRLTKLGLLANKTGE
jgi:hypothetical protein